MSQYILTAVDLTGIQKYIFNSNNLKHIVGASELVYRATRNWVHKALVGLGATNLEEEDDGGKINGNKTIDGYNLIAELVYAGGGNAVIIFQNQDWAEQFTRRLTLKALVEAPGLELVVAHQEFAWGQGELKNTVDCVFKALRHKKDHRRYSTPILGLSVTAACQFTGAPAVAEDKDNDNRLISAEIQAKLKVEGEAHQRLIDEAGWPTDRFTPPKDFDHFGRMEGESSYIAVVHADGNGMGKRIEELIKECHSDREYITKMRDFSFAVQAKAKDSMRATLEHLVNSLDENNKIRGEISLTKNDNDPSNHYLPFRPLIFGGDDLTFICDGRLGLTLTAFYLQHFTGHTLPPDETPIYVRAGVAVVKTHYPFVRAYQLAEELAKSVKEYMKDNDDENVSAMDWHFAVGGMVEDLKRIREKEYTVKNPGDLLIRPVPVVSQTATYLSWQEFRGLLQDFKQQTQKERNKVKAMREVLRDGPEQVKAFGKMYGYSLPELNKNISNLTKTGWHGNRCYYFDAIEALDFFVPLSTDKEEHNQ